MRVVPQISVTTIEQVSERLGRKRVLLTSGTTAVLVAFSFNISPSLQTDWFSIPASTTYKFVAPKGKKIWYVFCKTASGTSTLDICSTEMDLEVV